MTLPTCTTCFRQATTLAATSCYHDVLGWMDLIWTAIYFAILLFGMPAVFLLLFSLFCWDLQCHDF